MPLWSPLEVTGHRVSRVLRVPFLEAACDTDRLVQSWVGVAWSSAPSVGFHAPLSLRDRHELILEKGKEHLGSRSWQREHRCQLVRSGRKRAAPNLEALEDQVLRAQLIQVTQL